MTEKLSLPNLKIEINWDVSDIDPVTMFPKDCRFYNGGAIAPPEIRKLWKEEAEKEKEKK